MPYLNELITDDDKARIDWMDFKWNPYADAHSPWKWTIDREQDAFLVLLCGIGRDNEHPEKYAFYWQGDVIIFSADRDGRGPPTERDMIWQIYDIEMPRYLSAEREFIIESLREAIDVHGSVYVRETVRSVTIAVVERPKRPSNLSTVIANRTERDSFQGNLAGIFIGLVFLFVLLVGVAVRINR